MKFLSFVLISVLTISEISGGTINCGLGPLAYYQALGCKPIKSNPTDKCPSRYDCDHLKERGEFCLFQGKKLNVGDRTHDTGSCDGSCICNDQFEFTCPAYDCPKLFRKSIGQDCYHTYKLDTCCPTGIKCPPFENGTSCNVDGNLYREGQRFSPKDSCLNCICTNGFKGKFEEPYCKVPTCVIELRHTNDLKMNCAPIFNNAQARCCPYLWLCPTTGDTFVSDRKHSEDGKICNFGNKQIKSGSVLKTTYEKYGKRYSLKCDCQLPPFLTCLVEHSESIK